MVSVHLARGLVRLVERAGIPRAEYLSKADIPAEKLEATEGRLISADVYRMIELALDLTGDPALGLHWTEQLGTNTFGAVALLSVHAATMGDALRSLLQFLRLIGDEQRVVLLEEGPEAQLRFKLSATEPPRIQRFGAELAMAGFFRFMQHYGVHALPRQACFEHPAPLHRDEYARIFRGTERFDQPFTGVVFDRAHLSLPSPNRDQGVHEALKSLAESQLSRLTQRTYYAPQVRDLLVNKGWPYRTDMATIAGWLDLSVRTLRRRLAEEGKSYEDILSEALGVVAKRLLGERDRTIDEVGVKMGFSSRSAFHRAFKRWTGTTPKAYRAMLFGPR